MSIQSSSHCRGFLVKGSCLCVLWVFFVTVNGGHNHCNLTSEKKNMMDMEMTSSSVPVCRQGLFIHTGNSLMRDHPLSCERLLHVGQLNLTHSDIRYHFKFYGLIYFALGVLLCWKYFPVASVGAAFRRVFLAFSSFWKSFGCSFNCTAHLQVCTAWACTCAQTALPSSAWRSCCLCSHSLPALRFKYSFSVGTLPACSEANESFVRGLSRVRLASTLHPNAMLFPNCSLEGRDDTCSQTNVCHMAIWHGTIKPTGSQCHFYFYSISFN